MPATSAALSEVLLTVLGGADIRIGQQLAFEKGLFGGSFIIILYSLRIGSFWGGGSSEGFVAGS